MLKRLLKLWVSAAVWSGDLARAAAGRLMGRAPKPRCVVLYYHAIPREFRARFARQMDELVRLTQPVSCEGANGLAPGRYYAAVSFDDGFVSVLENALPELEARQIPATLFVPTCCLGHRPPWIRNGRPGSGETVVSAESLARLKDHRLLTIGSHSVSHPNFLRLGEEEAKNELTRSKQELESILGRTVTLFSFPHGEYNSRLVELARQAGYRRVFTIEPELAFQEAGEIATGRVAADPRDWAVEFRLKLFGAYRWNTHDRK